MSGKKSNSQSSNNDNKCSKNIIFSVVNTLLQIAVTIIIFLINLNFTEYNKQLNELTYESNIKNVPLQFDIKDNYVVDTKNRFCYYNKDAPRTNKQELNYDLKIKFLQGQVSDAYMVNLSNDKNIVDKIKNIDIDNENKIINLGLQFNQNNYRDCRLETDDNNGKYNSNYFKVSDTMLLYVRFIDYMDRYKEYLIIILPPIDALQDTMDFAKKYYNSNYSITNNGYVSIKYKIIDLGFFTKDTLEKEINSIDYMLPHAIDINDSKEILWKKYKMHPTIFSCYEYTKPDYNTLYERIKYIQSIGIDN